jgi:CheY-like chemotaxis protein
MLQHLGFEVVAARDGFEALERYRPGEFALVFMDLTMPRMDGKEAFQQMQARDPAVKVVLASGYSELEAIEPLLGTRPAGFIQKPFSLKELTAALEKALG